MTNYNISTTTGLSEKNKVIISEDNIYDYSFIVFEGLNREYEVYLYYEKISDINENPELIGKVVKGVEIYQLEKSEDKGKQELAKKYIELVESLKKYK